MPTRRGSIRKSWISCHADTFRILGTMLFGTLIASLYIMHELNLRESNSHKGMQTPRDSVLNSLKKVDRDTIIFLHLHKSGGTFFVSLVSKFPGQTMPRRRGGNALLFCPPVKNQSQALRTLCGNSSDALMPFWLWSARIQAPPFLVHSSNSSSMS